MAASVFIFRVYRDAQLCVNQPGDLGAIDGYKLDINLNVCTLVDLNRHLNYSGNWLCCCLAMKRYGFLRV